MSNPPEMYNPPPPPTHCPPPPPEHCAPAPQPHCTHEPSPPPHGTSGDAVNSLLDLSLLNSFGGNPSGDTPGNISDKGSLITVSALNSFGSKGQTEAGDGGHAEKGSLVDVSVLNNFSASDADACGGGPADHTTSLLDLSLLNGPGRLELDGLSSSKGDGGAIDHGLLGALLGPEAASGMHCVCDHLTTTAQLFDVPAIDVASVLDHTGHA
jgi:hypothetical protein